MRKITPMILVALMLVSALSSFDFAELEETEVIEDAGARAGADAEMVAITNPKETVCPFGAACRNVMKVGDVTEFSSYIQNSGDADITEMQYSVTVYLSDADGNPGMVAKDATTGADLTWSNPNVMCASAANCDFTSLAAGDVLGGGKHTMSVNGAPITWTPAKGLYVVEMIVDASPDADVGNDAQQIFVSVEDWYDITVDLQWLDADGELAGDTTAGDGTKEWSLTVTADGSDTFDPRNVTIRMETSGDVLAAQDVDGNVIDGSGTSTYTAGTSMTVDTYQDVSTEPPTITTDSRDVLSTWTLTGSLSVSTQNADALYGMKASLIDYAQYGQWQKCVTTGTENETYDNFCEETFLQDAYPSTDSSTIDGSASIFHDIRISQMNIVQGFNADGSGQGTIMVNENSGGDLNVGTSYLHVEVEHRGSSAGELYDWSVDFSVTDSGGATVDTDNVTTCDAVEPAYPMYGPLGTGMSASMQAYACAMVSLEMDGEYTFSAELVPDDKMTDAKPSNNDRSMTLNVRNNAPLITSLDLLNDGDLYFGQADLLSMSVQVFDVDDPSASNLEIEWKHAGTALPGCDRANMQITCSVLILQDYVTNFPVSVTVYDAHGGEASEELMIQIWNDGGYSTATDSGLSMTYNMLYWGTAPFSINATDGEAMMGEELPGYTGMYDSVAVIDYTPSTTYSAVDVLSQSMSISFDKSLGATSLWYVNNNIWTMISDNPLDTNDATISEFAYTFPANSPVLSAGQMVLMGGSLAQAEVPTASITGFNAAPGKSGAILLNWNVDGTMLTGDSIDISICEAVDCTNAHEAGLGAGNTSYTYSGTNTVHGTNYSVSVAVCNEVGCSSPVGAGLVIADSEVDGGAAATDLTIAAEGNTWTVSWTATGDQTDVASWKVCYNRGTFTAGQIDETTCVDATGTSVDIDISTWSAGTYTYHFTAVPVDALGNSVAAGSMNSIDYQRDANNDNDADGTTVIGDDVESDVPTWTWGLIGGIVVVAFIAGAFILSRGGDGDEGKDWDY
mgnify:FL=1